MKTTVIKTDQVSNTIAYKIDPPGDEDFPFTLMEFSHNKAIHLVDFYYEDIDTLVNALLDCKREYLNEFKGD